MATQAYNPFSSNSGPPGGTPPPPGSPQRLALDNLIRRELRVADPNDPQQVAQALLSRYKSDPRAVAIAQEALGLPFLQTAPVETRMTQAPTSTDAELQQAMEDVERDLRELTTNSLLKDITPELEGWGSAVRSAITEGSAAARFSLDPRQRDKAFGIRRQLGDYARMARFVGALTPTLNLTYRKFAQSLDEVTSVLLVLMGEALSNVGFSGGRFLLQVPYNELQARRDAAIYALRNLVGATQAAYGPNDWPRGLDAYRNLFRLLEIQGQGDLRSLLMETELARIMDDLIQRAAHGRAEGLRALGATAKLDLQRFRRLVAVAQRSVSPESPPLTAFLEAIQLFADAFETGGGFRLLHIARPPILFYGLYGIGGGTAEQALVGLVTLRGHLAEQLDCLVQCECSEEQVTCQVMLDTILYDLDRAIDLYALGVDEFSEPERRAAAYGLVLEKVRDFLECFRCLPKPNSKEQSPAQEILNADLDKLDLMLRPILPSKAGEVDTLRIFVQKSTWPKGVGIYPESLHYFMTEQKVNIINFIIVLHKELDQLNFKNPNQPSPPVFIEPTINVISQELCIHKDAEARWENLVRTMSPNCRGIQDVFNRMESVLDLAIEVVDGVCEPFEPSLPPHYETSLDSIADDVDRDGEGRPRFVPLGRKR